ncbi:hypothetical protein DEM27_11605 [Metarhizobium album]|uniref:Uncharacterized protein n=1 Tax=Metarhizobium album TaxID=2182425 RepID=A0A2U2DS07_9HYPH|nr:hypothetical protein [Rhizobium album]PWE56077.1 hypothetical protein DEM27_11605 [Rhizobium album]
MPSLRHAAVLAALTLLYAAPVMATDFSREAVTAGDPYRDLPGVKEPKNNLGSNSDGFECRTELGERRYYRRDPFYRFGEPGVVYSCNRNGVTVESFEPPSRGGRFPGQKQVGWPWQE